MLSIAKIDLSVIIPIYNPKEEYLEECLNSITIPKLDNIEFILILDGCNKITKEICYKYKKQDSRIVVYEQENKGEGASRNKGIKLAEGKWITFIDADDWIDNGYLKTIYEKASKEESDIIIFDCYVEYKNKKVKNIFYTKNGVLDKEDIEEIQLQNIGKGEAKYFPNDCNISVVWAKLYRKDFILDNNLKFIEYKMTGLNFLIEPTEAILTNSSDTYDDGKKSENMVVIGLEDTVYRDYVEKAGGNYGDIIIYNNKTIVEINDDFTTTYYSKKAFKEDYNLQISLITTTYMTDSVDYKYQKVNCNTLKNNVILTDYLLEEFSDFTTKYQAPIIFVNMDMFQSINNDVEKYNLSNNYQITKFIWSDVDATYARIKCDNIIGFSNYIENIKQKQNIEIDATYYTLDNQEKIIYINIIKLMLNSILLAIIIIGIISTVNILNASLSERKQEFKIISDIGAQKKNIKNILLYEDIYMFLKATIISIIISTPIIYIIVKSMQNIIVLEKLQIPVVSICLFILMLFVMSLIVTITLAKSIKLKK